MTTRRRVLSAAQTKLELTEYANKHGLELPSEPRSRLFEIMDSLLWYKFSMECVRFGAFIFVITCGILFGIWQTFGTHAMLYDFKYWPHFLIFLVLNLLLIKLGGMVRR